METSTMIKILFILFIAGLIIAIPISIAITKKAKREKALLDQEILSKREIFISSLVIIDPSASFEAFKSLTGYLYLTSAGVEFYSQKGSVRKTYYYILWKDIDLISSQRNKLFIHTDGKKQVFMCDKDMAPKFEEAYIKYKTSNQAQATD